MGIHLPFTRRVFGLSDDMGGTCAGAKRNLERIKPDFGREEWREKSRKKGDMCRSDNRLTSCGEVELLALHSSSSSVFSLSRCLSTTPPASSFRR